MHTLTEWLTPLLLRSWIHSLGSFGQTSQARRSILSGRCQALILYFEKPMLRADACHQHVLVVIESTM